MADRQMLLRDLDDARALLLSAIEGMTGEDLTRSVPGNSWTMADLLHHIAAWDDIGAATVEAMKTGSALDAYVEDVDAWNENVVSARQGKPLEKTLVDLHAARERLRSALNAAPPSLWNETHSGPSGQPISLPQICATWTRHDSEHAAELRVMRDRDPAAGPQTS